MEFRCPFHDVVFETQTDHSKPGTRGKDQDGRPFGVHVHPLYMRDDGYIAGHPDCPLCQLAKANGDPALLPEEKPGRAQQQRDDGMRVNRSAVGQRIPL
jgi:hypothetical protein